MDQADLEFSAIAAAAQVAAVQPAADLEITDLEIGAIAALMVVVAWPWRSRSRTG